MILGCIADDLTGAVELASMLIAANVPTSLTIGTRTAPPPGAVAHVIALKTRVAPVEAAISDVTAAAEHLRKQSCRQMFFKYCATFNSTPAGNIGPCAEALLETLGTDFTAFCPSFCEVGRTVYQGHMFAGEQLLSESPKRHDPLTPMTDSNLVRVLARQSARPAGLIPFAAVRKGPEAIRLRIEDLRRQGVALRDRRRHRRRRPRVRCGGLCRPAAHDRELVGRGAPPPGVVAAKASGGAYKSATACGGLWKGSGSRW